MRANTVTIAVLLLLPLLVLPQVHSAAPRALASFSGSLEPNGNTSFTWDLRMNIPSFLFHYEITGGAEATDLIDVSIDETGDLWQLLMGDGWTYCSGIGAADCPIDAGSYTVSVFSDLNATGPINFRLGFSLVPQPPVDFAGFMPANADLQTRVNSFGITFPNTTATYPAILGVTTGTYELFIDGASEAVVTETTTLPLDLEPGFHLFEVDATGTVEDVRWTVQVQGPPKLEVTIVDPCPVLNPESGQSTCVTGAEAVASDGSSPTVEYVWTTSGGTLNSTSGRWVEFTAPPGVASFSLTVNASAPGYLSDSTSEVVSVVPEFPEFIAPLLLMLTCTFVVLAQKKLRPVGT